MSERKPSGADDPMEPASTRASKKPQGKPAKLSRDVQARLGQQLRAIYDDVVSQGVPDRFTELLNRLEADKDKDSR